MARRPFEQILTVADLETTADRLGNFFFTPGAMKFFNSRIGYRLYNVDDSHGYFVTSEKMDGGRRYWTVRQYKVIRESDWRDILDIDQASEFQAYASAKGAERRAEELQGYALIDPKSFDIER